MARPGSGFVSMAAVLPLHVPARPGCDRRQPAHGQRDPGWFRGRRYYVPENGLDPERIALGSGWKPPEPGTRFRFLTLGRLVPYKGMELIIEAMAQFDDTATRCRAARDR